METNHARTNGENLILEKHDASLPKHKNDFSARYMLFLSATIVIPLHL